MISVPNLTSTDAATICSEINASTPNLGCTEVAHYGAGAWQTYLSATGSTNFSVSPAQGVTVLVAKSGSWTPH
jgi:hypothetical protein